MKKIGLTFIIMLLLVVGVVVFNTMTFESKQLPVLESSVSQATSSSVRHAGQTDAKAIERLQESVRFQTVSYSDEEKIDYQAFLDFHTFLDTSFTQVSQQLDREVVNTYSLLYRWEGSNPDLKPVVLTGHMDVVPIEEASRNEWKQDPFGGVFDGEFIWGRGTVDDKITILGLLEAIEKLLNEGYQPERTIYLSFGHDEEIGGAEGAKKLAALLKNRGVEAEYVMDEGGLISQKVVPGIDQDVALIGTAEKGYMSISLTVNKEGGHSSMPEPETPIDILAEAITRLKENPPAPRITKPVKEFFAFLGPEMPFVNKMAFANTWLFEQMIISEYEKGASSNASIKTTFVPTIFNSGIKDNLIPSEAKVTINFRILPGETTDDVLDYVKAELEGLPVQIDVLEKGAQNPTKVASTDSYGFKTIQKTISEVYPQALISPYLMIGGTDAKQYEVISDDVYRFLPVYFDKQTLKLLHGVNERISKDTYSQAIDFYYTLIKNSSKQQAI